MKTSKSSLFLMELIIAILFFALASAVCIQLFVKAHLIGQSTVNQNHALLWSQNIAEIYRSSDISVSSMAGILAENDTFSLDSIVVMENAPIDSANLELHFDKDWNPCSFEESIYVVQFFNYGLDSENGLHSSHIQILQKLSADSPETKEIYSLSLQKHIPERSGSNHE